MAFPMHRYRDPLEQLLQAESYTCRGCSHQVKNEFFGTVLMTCGLKTADGTPRKHGRRCSAYNTGRDE